MVESSPDSVPSSVTSPDTGESIVGDTTEENSNSPVNSVANTSQKSIEVLYAGNKGSEGSGVKVSSVRLPEQRLYEDNFKTKPF